ncbi:TPA: cell wall anchor protein [Streptococcus equi subsp. zooepidemicus]|nr:cell wall anchor protein [Streptococcus equi subsp. zooepidemicus]HEL0040472.1 cell wall anchor protein [Streptococcus equi subsp. zooepidemicus]HEL0042427.1 cell wall anchor protein [Streptococcus equi subsp. zooepidemicus]HEL0044426.1 cell wall anchor protein [Streptococcus equi subsp. zooepidemicus]HEL0052454.1 cell wall anchor protein [Streptococcus equi subsp. zooepidemicus]
MTITTKGGRQLEKSRWLQFILSVCTCLCFLTPPVFASSKMSSVTIHFEQSDKETHLSLWRLPEDKSWPEMEALFKKTDAELTNKYPQVLTAMLLKGETDLVLADLPVGASYYVRETESEHKERVLAPFIVTVKSGGNQAIYAKNSTPQKRGSYPFVKLSSQGGTLEGATFEVWHQGKDKVSPVLKKNRTYLVASDSKGFFEVKDLPFGNYYLKEVQSPKGYLLSPKKIYFEVTDYSAKAAPTKIINTPKLPPKIEVPYTGNAVMIIVVLVGFVIFMLGFYVVHQDSKKNS